MRTSEDSIAIIRQRVWMPATVAYDTVNPNLSSIDDPSAHVLNYISYGLSMLVVFSLKDILGLSIFVFWC